VSQVVDDAHGAGPPGADGAVALSEAGPAGQATPPPAPPERDNRRALWQLVLVVVSVVALAFVLHFVAVLIVILALVLMIMLHELGHFATAKWSGMKVTEYFLGFGPRLWSVRRGETEYGVKAIPAGGYVRIVGMTTAEEVDPPDEPRTYRRATFPRRLAVGVAGSTMHFVMAFALLFSMYAFAIGSEGISNVATTGTSVGALYSFTSGKTPAQKAGLKPGDVFVSVDGKAVVGPGSLTSIIEAHVGQPLHLVVRRQGHLVDITVVPVDGRHVSSDVSGKTATVKPVDGPASGVIGVELGILSSTQRTGFLDSFVRAGGMLGSLTRQTGLEIGQIFSPHGLSSIAHDVTSSGTTGATGSTGSARPVSIVGVVEITSQAASNHDIGDALYILVAVNVFVGMINLFPMLPLDGGHVAIAVYERIRSRKGRRYYADVQKMMPVAYLLLAFIILFGLAALYLDIAKPIGG
jgi:membrane-associated protease RseP (regulator of RpoE activity)